MPFFLRILAYFPRYDHFLVLHENEVSGAKSLKKGVFEDPTVFFWTQNFVEQKNFDPKFCWTKKVLTQNFWPEKIWVKKNYQPKRNFSPKKNFGQKKNFGLKKNFGPKKMFGQK